MSGELPHPLQKYTPAEADCFSRREMELVASAGQVSAEYAYFYPPGIPVLVPGEVIGRETLQYLLEESASGLTLQGLRDESGGKIQILQE